MGVFSLFAPFFFLGYIGCRPFLCKEMLLLGAAACPGRPLWGCSHFLCLFSLGISDVARFSARGCCCSEPPRALGGLHGGVLTFCTFFSLGISDVARFSAWRCCCWGPPRALGGLHGGVLAFCAFFPMVSPISPAEENPEVGAGGVYRWYGGSQRLALPCISQNPHSLYYWGLSYTNQEKLRHSKKRGPIIYLAVLKKGAIRHAHPYYAIYRKSPTPPPSR